MPEAIQEWRSRHLIDYRQTSDQAVAGFRWDDRVVWEGNLLGAFEAIYPKLISGLPIPFQLHHGTRVDDSPLHMALREALVNLLVHTDYSEADASLILRSADGSLFRNPGSSRIPLEDLRSGDRSDPRNPILVRMFRHIGLAEEAGTGLAQIFRTWWESRFQPPDIDVDTERYEFSLRLPYRQLISEQDKEWLYSVGDEWSGPEELALLFARRTGFVDNAELRSLARLHPADATKVLTSLRARGYLEAYGTGRGTRYELSDSVLMPPKGNVQIPEQATGTSSGAIGASSGDNESNSGNVHSRLESIAQPASIVQRLRPATRDQIILNLCAVTPLSLAEIASYLNRSVDAIRDPVTLLRSQGSLEYLYPQSPTHPAQKYRTVNKPADQAP